MQSRQYRRKDRLAGNLHSKDLLLHSGQDTQYTSRVFTDYCKEAFSSDEELNEAAMEYIICLYESYTSAFI